MTYTLNGVSGTLNLSRFTFAPVTPDGTYIYSFKQSVALCTNPALNGTFYGSATAVFKSLGGGNFSLTTSNGLSYSGTYQQGGAKIYTNGATFTYMGATAATSLNISFQDNFFIATEQGVYQQGETCSFNNQISGIKQQ